MKALTIPTANEAAVITIDRRAANLAVLLSNKSANTRAQIASTWGMYTAWCETVGADVWELDAVQAEQFLMAHPARPSTQRARLSHLRTVLGLHAETSGTPALQYRYAMLKLYNLPVDADSAMFTEQRNRRDKRALESEEIYTELNRTWATPELTLRNRAIISLLFYAGLRRSEVCNLKWSDVDLRNGTLSIVGAKAREADHVDIIPLVVQAARHLEAWRKIAGGRTFVFAHINKYGKLMADKPISGEAVRLVCGVEFMPHDARRTLGTRSIENGTPVNVTQQVLRHKTPDMTLEYAKYVDAKRMKDKLKFGY